MALKGELMQH